LWPTGDNTTPKYTMTCNKANTDTVTSQTAMNKIYKTPGQFISEWERATQWS